MGCSSSTQLNETSYKLNSKRSVLLENAERMYKTNHEKFEMLILDPKIKEDFEQKSNSNINQFLDTFHFKWKANFDNVRLSKEEVTMIVYEKIAESLIIDHLRFKDWDVIDLITHLLEHLNSVKDKSFEIIEDLILTSSRYFPNNQKGCIFPDKNAELVKMKGYKAIYNTLKFNLNFKMQLFVVFLCPALFTNVENIFDICDIVASNENLNTLVLMFSNTNPYDIQYNPENKHLSSVASIFELIPIHPNLSTLVFGCQDNYVFNLPLETIHAFMDMVKNDKLISLCVTKLCLKNEEVEILFEIIGNLSKLKFLILDIKFESKYEEKFVNMVRKNKKLLGVFLSGAQVSNVQVLEEKILKDNTSLKVFHFEQKVNFFI
jgi:hypothetical protein